MPTLVRNEAGMTLVELLIAMTLMAIGIAAIVAGFSSGVFAITRAHQASAAAVIADTQMETYRQGPWDTICTTGSGSTCSIPTTAQTSGTTTTGSDGKTYWVGTTISWNCAVGTLNTATNPPTCTSTAPTPSTDVLKLVSIEVREPTNSDGTTCATGTPASCTGKLYYREDSTFDSLTS